MVAIMAQTPNYYFFLQGPSSTRKIFLYYMIYYHLQQCSKTILYIALSGITALLLPHSCIVYS
jgi:hypothetical protein